MIKDLHHPAADSATVQLNSDNRADLDSLDQVVGDQVIKTLVQPRYVREDAGNVGQSEPGSSLELR